MAKLAALYNNPLTNPTTANFFTAISGWVANGNSTFSAGANGTFSATGGTASPMLAIENTATYPTDQYARCTFYSTNAAGWLGLALRANTTSGGNGYLLTVNPTQMQIQKIVNGSSSYLFAAFGNFLSLFSPGSLLHFEVVQNLFTVRVDGTFVWSGMDQPATGALAGGSPGFGATQANPAVSNVIHGFEAGSAVRDTIVTPNFLIAAPVGAAGLPGGAGTWRTASFGTHAIAGASPPPDVTTGVMCCLRTQATQKFATRRTGSTDTTVPTAFAGSPIGQSFISIPVTPSGTPQLLQFDVWIDTAVTVILECLGYYGPETVFFPEAVPVTIPAGSHPPGTPAVIDLTSYLPAGQTPVAIIADLWGDQARIVPNTAAADLANWVPTGQAIQNVICGMTPAKTIALTCSAATVNPVLRLRGYMKYGFTWENPPFDASPSVTGASRVANSPALLAASGVTGALYNVRGAPAFTLHGGSVTTWQPNIPAQYGVTQGIAPVIPTARITPASLPLPLAEQGFFTGANPAPFALSASPTSLSLTQNTSDTVTIHVDGTGTVLLSFSNVPVGMTANITPTTLQAPGTATVTINAGVAAPGVPHEVWVFGSQGNWNTTLHIPVDVAAATGPVPPTTTRAYFAIRTTTQQ